VESIPLPDASLDAVVSFETIEHVDENTQRAFLREIKRLLKPAGILIISTPNKHIYSDRHLYRNDFHVKEFYEQEFIDFLRAYFCSVDIFYQSFQVTSIINGRRNDLKVVTIDDFQQEGKYLLAVCSNTDSGDKVDPGSLVYDTDRKYQRMTERVLSLQDEVEDRNNHIRDLDREIAANEAVLDKLKTDIETNNERIRLLEGEVATQNAKVEELYNELSRNFDSYNTELINKDAHIEVLLQQEKLLNSIQRSKGYKILQGVYRTIDRIFPMHSSRRLFAKIIYRLLNQPSMTIKKINWKNTKAFFSFLSQKNRLEIETKMHRYYEKCTPAGEFQFKLIKQEFTGEKLVFTNESNPLVTIIVPVYNQWGSTYSCLKAIWEYTEGPSYEVIVADDASTDETININQYVENIVVVRGESNHGFLYNCNHAAEHARGRYVHFLNNDTNVQPGWLSSLVKIMESDQAIGIVGSKLVYPDGRLQEAGGIIWNDASGWNYGRLDDPDKPEYNYLKEVDYISGASFMIRKALWEEIGGFDKRFAPAYYEDTDLAFECRAHGYRVVYQPKSVVVHFEGVSHGTDEDEGIKSYQAINRQKFYEKWKDILVREHFDNGQQLFWARDRSRYKKTILVIDHYVPHYDKDAGSRLTFMYLKLFMDMGYNVKFLGDNFFKHEPYTDTLQQIGIEVLHGVWYRDNYKNWIIDNADKLDYAYLNRPHISIKYVTFLREKTNARLIYFDVDLHYLRELRRYEVEKDEECLKLSEYWKGIEYQIFQQVDVILTPSKVEEAFISADFPDKTVLTIPLFIYDQFKISARNYDERNGLLFVGSFNHTPNVDGVKWLVSEVYPKVSARLQDVKLYITGSNPTGEILSLSSENVVVTGYVSDERLEKLYNKVKLVLIPLRYGAGVKGKTVEAIYYRVPMVTTSNGIEGLPEVNTIILPCDEAEEFAERIIELYIDKEKWEHARQRYSGYLEKYFSTTSAKSILEYVFEAGSVSRETSS
jgi:GT2 family glycosyltransferase/SAM-dependent methyltransferase